MAKQKTTPDEKMKRIKELAPTYPNRTAFSKDHPYLYRWCLIHDIDISELWPKAIIHCKIDKRTNKGVDVYEYATGKLFKHYPYLLHALQELDITYYFVKRYLDGKIPHVNGFTFVMCDEDKYGIPKKYTKKKYKTS